METLRDIAPYVALGAAALSLVLLVLVIVLLARVGKLRRAQTIVTLINTLVGDLIEAGLGRIEAAGLDSPEAIRSQPDPVLAFSPAMEASRRELKRFLSENFYRHPRVLHMTRKAERIVEDLFRVYSEDTALLPENVQTRFALEGEARAIADYVAGMTDRFAMSEHRKLLDPHEPIGV